LGIRWLRLIRLARLGCAVGSPWRILSEQRTCDEQIYADVGSQ
jgi:hypothetical protein